MLSLVDSHKQMVLQEVVCGLNPNAAAGGPILRSLAARFYLGFTSVFTSVTSLWPRFSLNCTLMCARFDLIFAALSARLPHSCLVLWTHLDSFSVEKRLALQRRTRSRKSRCHTSHLRIYCSSGQNWASEVSRRLCVAMAIGALSRFSLTTLAAPFFLE